MLRCRSTRSTRRRGRSGGGPGRQGRNGARTLLPALHALRPEETRSRGAAIQHARPKLVGDHATGPVRARGAEGPVRRRPLKREASTGAPPVTATARRCTAPPGRAARQGRAGSPRRTPRRATTGWRWRGNGSDRPDFGGFGRCSTRSRAEDGPAGRSRATATDCQERPTLTAGDGSPPIRGVATGLPTGRRRGNPRFRTSGAPARTRRDSACARRWRSVGWS